MSKQFPTSLITYAAFASLCISVIIHFLVGVSELSAVVNDTGTMAFAALMLSGVLVPVVLVAAMASGMVQPKTTYVALSGVMVLYIVAYVDVHALGTLESLTGADLHTHDGGHDHGADDHDDHGHDDHGHGHDESVLDVVGNHLVDDPLAVVSKVSEGVAAAFFALLAAGER